jgi:hypothetical protein
MKYAPLGKTGLNVFRLSFGASALVRRLHWTPEGFEATLRSAKAQAVLLELPIRNLTITAQGSGAKVAKAGLSNHRKLTLPAAREITLKIVFKQ